MTVNEVIDWAGVIILIVFAVVLFSAIITALVIEFCDEVKTRKVLRDRMKR